MRVISTTNTMLLRYNSKPIIPPVSNRYLGDPTHTIRPKIAHMYATRDTNTLWWRVAISQLQMFKRVVRSWCSRRARIAFQEALKHQGYDKLGRPLPSAASNRLEGLTGSIELVVRPTIRDQSFQTVQRDADHLLESLLQYKASPRGRTSKRSETHSASASKL